MDSTDARISRLKRKAERMSEPLTLAELENLRYLKRMTQRETEKLQELYARAGAHSPKLDFMPKNRVDRNQTEEVYTALIDQKTRAEERLQELQKLLIIVQKKIDLIPSFRMQLIILLRYQDGFTWQEVAAGIGGMETEYSVKNAFYRFMKEQNTES